MRSRKATRSAATELADLFEVPRSNAQHGSARSQVIENHDNLGQHVGTQFAFVVLDVPAHSRPLFPQVARARLAPARWRA